MKKLLLLIFSLISFKSNFAQIDTAELLEGYIQSEFVFEGEVKEKCYYYDSNGNIYTNHKIDISKIIKGNIICGTINLLTEGGVLNGYDVELSHNSIFNIGEIGVFLCKNNMLPKPSCELVSDNTMLTMLTFAALGNIEYLFDQVSNQVIGFNSLFPTIEDFYEYLDANSITITNCNASIIESKKREAKILTKQKPKTKTIVNYDLSDSIDTTKNIDKQVQKKANAELEFLIGTPALNSQGDAVTIDIKVKSDQVIYLERFKIWLGYNSLAFGQNIATNTNIIIDNAYLPNYNQVNISNINTNRIQLTVNSPRLKTPAEPRLTISTDEVTFLTLTIPIINCQELYNFEIVTYNGAPYNLYAAGPTTGSVNSPVDIFGSFQSGSSILHCSPEITDLAKTSTGIGLGFVNVVGGIGDEFFINGTNFGTTKGKVFVRNADIGGPASGYIALDDYDVTWGPSQIKVVLPGYSNNGLTNYNDHVPGSGFLYVQDAQLFESNNNLSLNINYSVDNFGKGSGSTFYKNNVFLFSSNTDHLYHFKLHSSVTNQSMIDCITEALRLWSCKVGIGFVLDNGTTNHEFASDTYNVISVSDLNDASKWATTSLRRDLNCSFSAGMPASMPEVDIRINSTKLAGLFYDKTGLLDIPSNMYDFFHIILHEIGHAALQNHVINQDDFMHANLLPFAYGPRIANQRRLNFRPGNLGGGDYVVDKSKNQSFSMICSKNLYTTMLSTPCRNFTIGVSESKSIMKIISIKPNPFSNELNLQLESAFNSILEITLIDAVGKVVLEKTSLSKNQKEITLNTENLTNGFYHAIIETLDGTETLPLIKIKN